MLYKKTLIETMIKEDVEKVILKRIESVHLDDSKIMQLPTVFANHVLSQRSQTKS